MAGSRNAYQVTLTSKQNRQGYTSHPNRSIKQQGKAVENSLHPSRMLLLLALGIDSRMRLLQWTQFQSHKASDYEYSFPQL